MRGGWLVRLLGVGLILLAACQTGEGAAFRQAEILDEPFPATLMDFHIARFQTCGADGCRLARSHHCDENGCEIAFTVRVTNPTDRDVNVARCVAVVFLGESEPRNAPFAMPGGAVAGVWLPAGSTRQFTGASVLPLSYDEIRQLPDSVDGTCEGWDWHGEPPE